MTTRFAHYPTEPRKQSCMNAFLILCSTHETCSSFLDIYDAADNIREGKPPTNQEQDLLRSILVFAASGIDAMVKQLIRDALGDVINIDLGAEVVFKDHVEKKLRKGEPLNSTLLIDSLLSESPRAVFLADTIRDLTSSSLQSKDELLRISSYFNIPSNTLTNDFHLLRDIFITRNQIVHEMDIDLNNTKLRRQRTRESLVSYTNELFRIANVILEEIDNRLQ